jgi:hypothetical protein
MEGSFKVRIGELVPQNPLDSLGFGGAALEWKGYTFKQFAEEWPPEKFITPP